MILVAVFLAILMLSGCYTPFPRRFSGDGLRDHNVMVSVNWAAFDWNELLFITPDLTLVHYNESTMSDLERRYIRRGGLIDERFLGKLLDDVVFIDWASGGQVALTKNSELWHGSYLQDGDGTHHMSKLAENVRNVTVGTNAVLAIKTNNELWFWPNSQQIAINMRDHAAEAAPIFIMENVAQASASEGHFMVLSDDGQLWLFTAGPDTWGVPIMEDIEFVSTGHSYAMAIDKDGALWSWMLPDWQGGGANLYPRKMMENVEWVEVYNSDFLAIKTDGSLWGWGWGFDSDDPIMIYNGGREIVEIRYAHAMHPIRHPTPGTLQSTPVVNIIKADGSLYVLSPLDAAGFRTYAYAERTAFTLPPVKKLDNVVFADGGHAVKTDGSLWYIRTESMLLPPGSVWTGPILETAVKHSD